jgi:two-component system, OmpR family, sensor histidine kinase KdpD
MDAFTRIRPKSFFRTVGAGVLVPVVATYLALALPHRSPASAESIYILAVVVAAAFGGVWGGVIAAVLSFVGLNYYFTVPYHTFRVHRADELVALPIFLIVAVVVGALVASVVEARDRAQRSTSEARALAAFTGRLLSGEPLDRTLQVAAETLARLFDLSWCEIAASVDGRRVEVGAPKGAKRVEPSLVLPLPVGEDAEGTLSVAHAPGAPALSDQERDGLRAFAAQISLALQRARFDAQIHRAKVDAEASDMRAALFSSITHDLRTPLASITASVSSLLDHDVQYDDREREDLLRTSLEEANRLNRMVANLLDLARMRAGALQPVTEAMPIEDVLESVLRRMEPLLRPFKLRTMIRPDLPLVSIDPIQIDQVLTNLLDNATRFAPPESEIRISANEWAGQVEVRVTDEGPGIPLEDRERVFEPFYKQDAGLGRGGTGLGLAIARAVVQGHGGRIRIEGTPAGGTSVVFDLPVAAAAPVEARP